MKRLLLAALALLISAPAMAQSVGTYVDSTTGVTQRALGVTLVGGTVASTGTATPADAVSNTNVNAMRTQGYDMVFNGTSWDRVRGDTNGLVSIPALTSTYWRFAGAAGGIVNTTTAVTVKAAAGAGIRNYVSGMQCSADPLGAATEFVIRDGASGTVMYRSKIQTSGTPDGREITFTPPLKGTANTLVEIATLTASVTGGVYCNLQGFTGN